MFLMSTRPSRVLIASCGAQGNHKRLREEDSREESLASAGAEDAPNVALTAEAVGEGALAGAPVAEVVTIADASRDILDAPAVP